jgi:putative ABC transport system permease protein
MLKSYFKIALRNIWKHKGYSFINIAGLAVGMACALFILLWVQDELSFNRFHANARSLFRVEQDQNGRQGKFHVNVTPYGMAAALKAEIPEIQETTRWARSATLLVRQGEKAFYENRVTAVDPSFLQMFMFPAIRGDAGTALSGPSSMVLTEDLARKYFGTEDAVGRMLTVNNQYPVTVSAVLKNVPDNSTIQFDALLPVSFLRNLGVDIESWRSNEIVTFVQLHPQSSVSAVNAKITRLVLDRTLTAWRGDAENWKRIQADPEQLKQYQSYIGPDFTLMPIVDINLYGHFGFDQNNQAIKTVTLFAVIAVFVLLIACINFMNLATARSANRAKEVGLRKVVGAFRKSIAGQFYGESILTAVLAGIAALVLVVTLLPVFNALSGKHMVLSSLSNPRFILGMAAVTLATGFIAGSYPALFLSSLQPVKVLKGRAPGGARSALFRRILVVIQFSLSILLLMGMGIVSRQIDYMRNKKLGYDKEQLIYMPLRGETAKNYAVLKERLLRDPKIQGVTATHQPPTSIGSNSWGATWDGKDPNQRFLIGIAYVDFDYPETMKIDMAAGRTFNKNYSTDNGKTFMVNEAVPKLMGLDAAAAVGQRFNFQGIDGTIVGVMKNFHYQSVRQSIEPLAVVIEPEYLGFAVVRLEAGDVPGSLDAVKAGWLAVNPQYPFDFRFFDLDFDQMFRSDERTGSILKVFAVMAVIIACLGLFGLASFTAEQRTNEIGIRKVLGASAPGIVVLLSKEFAKWVLMANVLAWPVAYLAIRNWLQGFAYKTDIAWWLFPLVGTGTLVVALLTVSFQALRAARADPVSALKYE